MPSLFSSWLKLGLIAAIVLWLLSLVSCKHTIEEDLTSKTQSYLQQQGIDNADVNATGRDLSIIVDYKNKDEIPALQKGIENLDGVRIAQIEHRKITPLIDRAKAKLAGNGIDWAHVSVDTSNNITLVGKSKDENAKSTVAELMQSLEGVNQVNNNIIVQKSPEAKATENRQAIDNILKMHNATGWLNIDINGSTATLSGKTVDKAQADILINEIKNLDNIDEVINNIEILEALSAQDCQQTLDRLLSEEVILFELGSTRIDKQSEALLEKLATVTRQCPGVNIEIAGHTDNQGQPEFNMQLSKERADAVVNEMVRFGVAKTRLTAVGYGETEPVASNDTEQGRHENRRIEFRVKQ